MEMRKRESILRVEREKMKIILRIENSRWSLTHGHTDIQTGRQTSVFLELKDILQEIALAPRTKEKDGPKSTKTIEWINVSGGAIKVLYWIQQLFNLKSLP